MPETPDESELTIALRHFEVAEANLAKLERLWQRIEAATPAGISFESSPTYEENSREYSNILKELTSIDAWKPTSTPLRLNDIGQIRLEAADTGEIEIIASAEQEISAAGVELGEYRFLLNQKRRELVRATLLSLIDNVDEDIRELHSRPPPDEQELQMWHTLREHVGEIDALLGSSKRPPRWTDLQRHMSFRQQNDLNDIRELDWPVIKKALMQDMYGHNEPIPSEVGDLSDLVSKKPTGKVTSKLKWKSLSPSDFERVLFTLISSEDSYENPEWLTKVNAPDKGRDLSVQRVIRDPLAGVTRLRVIIQCKHWLSKSVAVDDVASLEKQMKLWEPPRVDVHIIATSGRFTSDAIALIESQNQSDSALKIEMWPESHLERLLASRPALIAQFSLR